MPMDDIAGTVVNSLLRGLAWIIVELVFETIIKGTGYRVLIILRPRKEPSETACGVVGLLCWLVAVVLAFALYRMHQA